MDGHSISSVALRLRAGALVAFPTETFFGLGADPRSAGGVDELLSLKGRDMSSGVPLITDSLESVEKIIGAETTEVRVARERLLQEFWPGPLTVVFVPNQDYAARLAKGILAGDGSLAVRQSSCQLARDLAAQLDGFITSTSANPKAAVPPHTVQLVRHYFPHLEIIGSDIERLGADALPSTILQVIALPFKIIRDGAVSREQLGPYLS